MSTILQQQEEITQQEEQQQQQETFDRSQLREDAQQRLDELESELEFHFRRDAKNVYQIGTVLFSIRELIQQDLKTRGLPKNQRDAGFKAWCNEKGLTRQSVYRYISVYEAFKSCHNLLHTFDIPASVLYLLAKPSTPQAVRQDFIQRWEQGESIKIQDVKAAIAKHRGAKKRWTPAEFIAKLQEALTWEESELIRMEENLTFTDPEIYPDRHIDYQKKISGLQRGIKRLKFAIDLFACVQQGENPLIINGDFPDEFCIEIGEVSEKWGNFDEYAIEIEDTNSQGE